MAKQPSKGSGKPIPKVAVNLEPSAAEREALLATLSDRFAANSDRHPDLHWSDVQAKLEAQPAKLASLYAMESSGGEPDVIGYDEATGAYIFCDCSAQSPDGRRSICYDGPAQQQRAKKGVFPGGNAVELAAAMGVELLDEQQYRQLQAIGEFDTSTSSWLQTPSEVRKLGGAIFGDRRYNRVFIYHNGALSFYAARGFRGLLRV